MEVNGGVHGATGIEFQKHCALYILLDKWDEHKDRKYFLCIEHHDDVLFVYQTEDELIEKINAYQVKKASKNWGMTKKFFKILQKILSVGKALTDEHIPKDSRYKHQLTFISNSAIELKHKEKGKSDITCNINETNQEVHFIDLDENLKTEIKEKIKVIDPDLSEIDSLVFSYIDFAKTTKSQKRQLIGLFSDIFGSDVKDHKAAIDTLLSLFRDIEITFNQGATAKILDDSKRLNSDKIKDAIKIITTNTKAFELWREKKEEIGRILNINIPTQKEFELAFENSFDLFKDLKQVEHQKVFAFVKKNKRLMDDCYSDIECIEKFYEEAIKTEVLRQDELHLKATLFAAYIEIKDREWQ